DVALNNSIRESQSIDDSFQMGKSILVAPNHLNDFKSTLSRQIKSNSEERTNSKSQRLGITSRRSSCDFERSQKRRQDGQDLFRSTLSSIGVTNDAINNQVAQLSGSWRRHKTGLRHVNQFMKDNNILPSELISMKHPQIYILNMIAQLRNAGLSSSALLNVKKAISSLLMSLGHSSSQIYNHTTSTSVKVDRRDTAKEAKDKDTYDIDDLLCYIRRRVEQIDDMEEEELEGITLALLMSITTRRMAEISRAALEVATMTSEQFVLKSDIQKVGGSKVTLTIKRAKDQSICPVRWFSKWWEKQQPRSQNGQILWWNLSRNKPASADTCSKLTKQIIKAAGLPYRERITELRAAAITKMIDLGYPMSAINAWSIHSDTVRTLQKYYYRSNCSEIIDQLLNTSE
ncbi:MAG: hypothetical protein EZS28_047004, partial [Streblomastix strix]